MRPAPFVDAAVPLPLVDGVLEVDLSQRDDAHLDRLGDADGHPRRRDEHLALTDPRQFIVR